MHSPENTKNSHSIWAPWHLFSLLSLRFLLSIKNKNTSKPIKSVFSFIPIRFNTHKKKNPKKKEKEKIKVLKIQSYPTYYWSSSIYRTTLFHNLLGIEDARISRERWAWAGTRAQWFGPSSGHHARHRTRLRFHSGPPPINPSLCCFASIPFCQTRLNSLWVSVFLEKLLSV